MSLPELLALIPFFVLFAFLAFGSFLLTADEYWQRVRLFLEQEGEITTDAKKTGQQIKEIWRRLPLKERFSAHLPQYR